jgi:hypothetical protein
MGGHVQGVLAKRAARSLAARGESRASHRGRRCARMIHPTAHSPRRGGPGGAARRAKSGVPTVRVVHGGVQYREYLNEEQRSQTRGPQRGSRVGVEEGCSAGRMQLEFHHGLLDRRAFARTRSESGFHNGRRRFEKIRCQRNRAAGTWRNTHICGLAARAQPMAYNS